MAICSECGARWDSDDPFCPSCLIEKERAADVLSAKAVGDLRQPNGSGGSSGLGRKSVPPENGARANGEVRAESSEQAEGRRERDPAAHKAEVVSTDTYGAAVLALGEIEEEVLFPEEGPVEAAPRSVASASARAERERERAASGRSATSARANGSGARNGEAARKNGDGGAVRPPVLASEALRVEVAPSEPRRTSARALLLVIGVTGCALSVLLMRGIGLAAPLAGAFWALALLGAIPIPYAARAAAAFAISTCALGVVAWMELGVLGLTEVVSEAVGVTVLCAGLLLRAWHRASALSRFMVVVGVVTTGGWLGMTGVLSQLSMLDPYWQSWLPIVLRAPLGLLLMLSLLAFMDERSTGGCGIWAAGILLWEMLSAGVQLLVRAWPPEASGPRWDLARGDESISLVASPLLIALLAFSAAQLLAVIRGIDRAP